jgi:C4-dicarboxylate-specific signal transduction histidine kinase
LHEELIRRVLINLILNSAEALKESQEQPEKVINLFIKRSDDGEQIIIKHSDNGPGISEENLKKVFNTCFTTKKNGHGIGLVSIYKIINKLEGEISLDSQLGKGTTFEIRLPYIRDKKND